MAFLIIIKKSTTFPFVSVKLWPAGQIWPTASLYLAEWGNTKSRQEPALHYCTAHAVPILQIPECSAGILAHQSGQDVHLLLLSCTKEKVKHLTFFFYFSLGCSSTGRSCFDHQRSYQTAEWMLGLRMDVSERSLCALTMGSKTSFARKITNIWNFTGYPASQISRFFKYEGLRVPPYSITFWKEKKEKTLSPKLLLLAEILIRPVKRGQYRS